MWLITESNTLQCIFLSIYCTKLWAVEYIRNIADILMNLLVSNTWRISTIQLYDVIGNPPTFYNVLPLQIKYDSGNEVKLVFLSCPGVFVPEWTKILESTSSSWLTLLGNNIVTGVPRMNFRHGNRHTQTTDCLCNPNFINPESPEGKRLHWA